jgi:NAD(P)-dependent dehydrogenase (short-subunit alcohol dehydrogenase family)
MSTQRVVVITGASRGIGAGLVTAYRKLGYAVVANARSIAPSDDPMVLTVAGEIGVPGVGTHVVEEGLDAFGRIDTLINNAGVFVAKPFVDYTDADFDLVTGVNLRGFFEVSKRAIAVMLTQGGGHVVNISTSLIEHANGMVPSALAALSEGGLSAVTRSLTTEFGSRGIRVNTISPGVIRTSIDRFPPCASA